MTEFIYLVPGNWFELKSINSNKTQPYDLQMLEDEIMNQVLNRSENLSQIDIKFFSKYKNINIENIDLNLTKEKFDRIGYILESETRHPIITFHGTSSLEAVNSILDIGYIIPGSKNNNKIKVIHGSMYGTGIYSSPHFDKALEYTKPDDESHVWIIINIVFLGKVKLIPPSGFVDEVDKLDTKIVHGLEQLVSTDQSKLVPVGIIKIKI